MKTTSKICNSTIQTLVFVHLFAFIYANTIPILFHSLISFFFHHLNGFFLQKQQPATKAKALVQCSAFFFPWLARHKQILFRIIIIIVHCMVWFCFFRFLQLRLSAYFNAKRDFCCRIINSYRIENAKWLDGKTKKKLKWESPARKNKQNICLFNCAVCPAKMRDRGAATWN